jgi:hypothetical protein
MTSKAMRPSSFRVGRRADTRLTDQPRLTNLSRAMPESRRRKPKKQRQVATQMGTSKAATAQSIRAQPKRRVGKVIAALVTLFTVFTGAVVLWPRVTVEPTGTAEASNPFSGVFKVTNAQFYTLEDVRIEAILWCVKIGLGTDTTPIDRCERGMPSSKHEWNKRTLTADEAYEISLGDVLFATPSTLLYAEISVNVTFTPWVVAYHYNKEFRFYSRRKEKGEIEWLHRPLE